MMKRKRRRTEPGEFRDPLSNYDPPEYADDLERSLCEDPVTVIKHMPYAAVGPDDTIEQAMRQMAKLDVACLLVLENDRLLGMFTERDVLNKVAGQFDKVKHVPIRAMMTADPLVVYETESVAKALNLMAVGGFRHVPIVNIDDRIVGLLGPRRVTAYLQEQFAKASA